MGKLVGYARVSTGEQDTALQVDALKGAGCVRIFCEQVSGAKVDRPELAKCLEHLDQGDILVVWRLDRLGRSLQHLLEIVGSLKKQDIGLRSISEGWLDTTTANGLLIFQMFCALGEFERNLSIERTRAGLVAARLRGNCGGRREKLTAKEAKEVTALYKERTLSVKQICEKYQITRPTLHRYVNDTTR